MHSCSTDSAQLIASVIAISLGMSKVFRVDVASHVRSASLTRCVRRSLTVGDLQKRVCNGKTRLM